MNAAYLAAWAAFGDPASLKSALDWAAPLSELHVSISWRRIAAVFDPVRSRSSTAARSATSRRPSRPPTGSAEVGDRLRVGIVGCGDVAHRHYLPGIASRADRVAVAAVADPNPAAARASQRRSRSGRRREDVRLGGEMLAGETLDAVFNLTPAPLHGAVNREILEAGVACFSEKPLASSLARPTRSSTWPPPTTCSPRRSRLGRDGPDALVEGRHRRREPRSPTLAVAHHADAGPANWREYTGDPTPFYREGVGPVFDHGVYRLHEITYLLGPVARVQAMGTIALPRRRIRGGPKKGGTIEVTTPDHVLVQLEFASGVLGQLLASFGTLDTLAPWLELHFERGVVSFGASPGSWTRR
jgi:hypothetical protein